MTHQCARFSSEPKVKHGRAIRWLARYLKGTDTKGLILKPDSNKSLEVYVDSDFAGNWDQELAGEDEASYSQISTWLYYLLCWHAHSVEVSVTIRNCSFLY
jgi:hypothetical protein